MKISYKIQLLLLWGKKDLKKGKKKEFGVDKKKYIKKKRNLE